jgi:hypothetical protein
MVWVGMSRGQFVGGRMVWVGMSHGQFVGGRNVKALYILLLLFKLS